MLSYVATPQIDETLSPVKKPNEEGRNRELCSKRNETFFPPPREVASFCWQQLHQLSVSFIGWSLSVRCDDTKTLTNNKLQSFLLLRNHFSWQNAFVLVFCWIEMLIANVLVNIPLVYNVLILNHMDTLTQSRGRVRIEPAILRLPDSHSNHQAVSPPEVFLTVKQKLSVKDECY